MGKKSRSNSKKSTPVASPAGTPAGTPTKKLKAKQKTKSLLKKAVPSLTSVPRERILNSVQQLRKFQDASKNSDSRNLLDDSEELNESIQLIVVNNTSFSGSEKNFKLKLIDVKHSLYRPWNEASETSVKDFKVLLILKDSDVSKVSVDDFVLSGDERDVPVELICGRDLKTKYKAYEARRAFISEFSLILADDNVVTTLPKLLGGKAYSKLETTPIGVRAYANKQFSKKTLINSFLKVYSSRLPVKIPRGTTANVHLGKLQWFKDEELVDNIEQVLKTFLDGYKIRSVFVKCNDSPVLPLYYNQKVLEEISATKDVAANGAAEKQLVEIGGVPVELSTFDKALLEIANPDEVQDIFAKNINAAKRKKSPEEEEPESNVVKKAKN
ncbi:hypothetical protein HG536_0E03590 [Torulaspora globosa]|uniref:Proteasome-interacting protein CIC1 n=1 Tax=Torulaspora globosa TaxID=48254 RepID=A0A7G3ZIW2_9SACH|nr:uncharacterized protein HG536_0E03590 [Torulaspora globosa]QLL33448.1 hypothetical protein HG536_0E03590 [Torulaspora globosa]